MQKEEKTLHLTLKKKWFDMIASGEKKEEYREIKPYWMQRFGFVRGLLLDKVMPKFWPPTFGIVSANNGYQKGCPNIKWEHKGIRIGEGKPEWGAEPGKQCFILEIGNIISN